MKHRRVFTSQALALMQQMASQGCSAPEIAKAIGSTPASVRVMLSRHKIRLKRGRTTRIGQVAEHASRVPEHRVVVAYMPASLYTEFNRKAAHLDKPVSILASMLLNAIATSDIYQAVLDD